MPQAIHILSKEVKDYFISPVAYIVISVFLIITGWFFFATFFLYNQADMRQFFELLPISFAFIIPAVTMKLFAEEVSIGSYELLLTLPVTFNDIIIGKFLASVVLVAACLTPTLSYPLFISFSGQLDWGPVIAGYAGALLLGGAFAAVGLLASSLTRNQIVAFIVGMVICLLLTMIDKMLFFFPRELLGVVAYLGADFHFQNISKGVIDSRDILYFCSVVFIGLYGANLTMRSRT
jgi:ABC-2 type transport system permease protein